MDDQNYIIKDIADNKGVSTSIVDRVQHEREEVSSVGKETRQNSQNKGYNELYEPTDKKRYTIMCVTPYYTDDDYWKDVALGIEKAGRELLRFNVFVNYLHYAHSDLDSYMNACQKALESEPDALLLAPNFRKETREILKEAERKNIPYVFVDYNIEEANALKYIGQDSYNSGYLAAKILMKSYRRGDDLVLFMGNYRNSHSEIQMTRRLEGFIRFVYENYAEVNITEVIITKNNEIANAEALDTFFSTDRSNTLGAVFNSRAYQIGEYMHERNIKMKGLIGYDLLKRNVSLLKSEELTYLIGQRPMLQGYRGVMALTDKLVFNKQVEPVKYMPIDILIKENIDFYVEFE